MGLDAGAVAPPLAGGRARLPAAAPVHPVHARAMAHRLLALGQDVSYLETAEGGHLGVGSHTQRAWTTALVQEFAWRAATRRGRPPGTGQGRDGDPAAPGLRRR